MAIISLLFFGILPSVIWLLYFLREDVHPEPKKEILIIFLLGMMVPFLALIVEVAFNIFVNFFSFEMSEVLTIILVTPLIEEYGKYLVVKKIIVFNSVFDESTDLPIYMVTSAMGFAATENILSMFHFLTPFRIEGMIGLSYFRFLTANLLHALASGILGIGLAFSFYLFQKRKTIFTYGFLGAVLLHSLYDSYIMYVRDPFGIVFILFVSFFVVIFLFHRVKRLPAVCRIKI